MSPMQATGCDEAHSSPASRMMVAMLGFGKKLKYVTSTPSHDSIIGLGDVPRLCGALLVAMRRSII